MITSEVPAHLFEVPAATGGTIAAEDPAWLAEAALTHHEVVVKAHRCGSVLPLRFGTVFRNREDLLRQFAQHEQEWRSRLDRISGREECEIRLSMDASRIEEKRIESRAHQWAALPQGRRYLAERAARRQVQEELTGLEQIAWKTFEFGLGILVSESLERPNGSRVYLVEKNVNLFLNMSKRCKWSKTGSRSKLRESGPLIVFLEGTSKPDKG